MLQDLNIKLKEAIQTRNESLKKAIRNIKSEFIYETSTNLLSKTDSIIKLYNKRVNTMSIYKDINQDLYNDEKFEASLIKPYLPKKPLFAETVA